MPDEDLSKLKLDRSAGAVWAADRRPRWRRWLVPGVIVLAAGAAALAALARMRDAPAEVEQTSVTSAYPYQGFTVLTSTGYVVAQRKAAVASKATGRLDWLGVAEGSRVQKGDVIARLERNDVEASRDQAAANLKVARANVEQARVELKDAERELARAAELAGQNFVSRSVFDQASARVDKARASVRSLEAAVTVAQANLRGSEVNLEQTLIRAPFDGVVLTKNANVGDVVTPFSSAADAKGAVVTIADMSTLEVEADVSESNLSKVRVDQPVEIQLDALPDRRFRGRVARMVPTVDRAKATVMTKIRFVENDPRVLPEMSAKAYFLSQEATEAQRQARTAVMPDAIVKRGGQDTVFVVAGGVVRQVRVTAGARIGDLVEVSGAVQPGDKVVLKPAEKLAEGAKVKTAAK